MDVSAPPLLLLVVVANNAIDLITAGVTDLPLLHTHTLSAHTTSIPSITDTTHTHNGNGTCSSEAVVFHVFSLCRCTASAMWHDNRHPGVRQWRLHLSKGRHTLRCCTGHAAQREGLDTAHPTFAATAAAAIVVVVVACVPQFVERKEVVDWRRTFALATMTALCMVVLLAPQLACSPCRPATHNPVST